jgi:NADPH-dependent 2,4-dienoyl-CoA reductase/sulfur reductase-like enzyme
MRTVNHCNDIEKALSAIVGKPNVVIVGTGFIGMEAASILAKSANVTIIGMETFPFERVLGKEVGKAMANLNEKNGIILMMEKFVDKYEPSRNFYLNIKSKTLPKLGLYL